MRAEFLCNIILNYSVPQLTFEDVKELTTDTEIKIIVTGVTAQMLNFKFYFVPELHLLKYTIIYIYIYI